MVSSLEHKEKHKAMNAVYSHAFWWTDIAINFATVYILEFLWQISLHPATKSLPVKCPVYFDCDRL